jgi:thiosulfate/3-mercaptopyruvate sulfurtransferase
VILDVREKHDGAKLVPGSVAVPWKTVRAKATPDKDGEVHDDLLPPKDLFDKAMQGYGVNNDSAVVIVTTGNSASDVFFGTRLYWQMKYYGHDNVALLNGGAAKWEVDKLPTVERPRLPEAGTFAAKTERREMLATSKDVVEAHDKGSVTFIDGRSEAQYEGLGKPPYVSAPGRLKGARNLQPDMVVTNPKDGTKSATFLPVETLKKVAALRGIDTGKPAISYCNSGHLGSGTWFVMHELLGNKNAALYDGSMHAFTKNEDRRKRLEGIN